MGSVLETGSESVGRQGQEIKKQRCATKNKGSEERRETEERERELEALGGFQ